MNEVLMCRKRIITVSTISALVLTASAVMIDAEAGLSFAWGALFSIFNFYLLSREILKFSAGEPGGGSSSSLLRTYFLRYILLGLAIVIAFKYHLVIPLFAVGLFIVQGVIYFEYGLKKSCTNI